MNKQPNFAILTLSGITKYSYLEYTAYFKKKKCNTLKQKKQQISHTMHITHSTLISTNTNNVLRFYCICKINSKILHNTFKKCGRLHLSVSEHLFFFII